MLNIKAMPTPLLAACLDRIFWTSSPNGSFELKEAYRLANVVEDSTLCLICNNDTESIIHILRDCTIDRQTWNALSIPLDPNIFFNLNLVDWLRINCQSKKNHDGSSISWSVIFPVGIWTLWLFRHRVVFRNETSSRNLSSEILSRASEMAFIVLNWNHSIPQTTI